MMQQIFEKMSLAAAILAIAGCGGPSTNVETKTAEGPSDSGKSAALPSMESEIGGLDESKVQAAFQRTLSKLTACFSEGTRRVPFLGGEVRFALRIGKDGSARVAYLKDSTLGDRDTESCMLGAVRAASWPSPVGGKEGLAEGGFNFDPSADERPPVELPPDKLGKELRKAEQAVERCRKDAGAGPLKVTMYIDTDGKPLSVGISSSDDKGEGAAGCVIDAIRGLKFSSPGSYAGKVVLDAD
jgi:hypothetical protein